eukprot:TRINITY_DN4553_c2_g1_i7.p2 TRINITY_DN4553_c2_g1~~TRINITY_DN4553_c2_g1_i7.p2  ORF type:complete len:121 (+),score=11.89 TRINITY_DN4553_c2_g1_i7:207-569(+)
MTSVVQNLHNHKPYHDHDSITTANGDQLPISGMGNITIGTLTLPNVYFVPNLVANLISIGQLVEYGYLVNFSPSDCVIQDRQTGKVIRIGNKNGRLFLLDMGQQSFLTSSSSLLNNMWTT